LAGRRRKSLDCLGAALAYPLQSAGLVRIPILAALLAASSTGCLVGDLIGLDKSSSSNDECTNRLVRRLHVEPVDAPLELRLESCRLDADACTQLCTLALSRAGEGGATTESCHVAFQGDGADLYIRYAKDNGRCAFDDVAAGAPR
jgi:hypothetical protein